MRERSSGVVAGASTKPQLMMFEKNRCSPFRYVLIVFGDGGLE
jgi:hypothetical protein